MTADRSRQGREARTPHRAARLGGYLSIAGLGFVLVGCGADPGLQKPAYSPSTASTGDWDRSAPSSRTATMPPRRSVSPRAQALGHRGALAFVPPRPRVVIPKRRLQCVPFARAKSGIQIRGDAWTWWSKARRRYQRSSIPAVGAVLAFKRRGRSRGHLSVVTHVVSDREIVVDHANWLNRGRIHRHQRVRDISRNNDWSRVRVWHTPTRQYGIRTYAPYGFIYPVDLRRARKVASREK